MGPELTSPGTRLDEIQERLLAEANGTTDARRSRYRSMRPEVMDTAFPPAPPRDEVVPPTPGGHGDPGGPPGGEATANSTDQVTQLRRELLLSRLELLKYQQRTGAQVRLGLGAEMAARAAERAIQRMSSDADTRGQQTTRKKKRARDAEDTDSGDGQSEDDLDHESKVMALARRRPGHLLESGLKEMRRYLATRHQGSAGSEMTANDQQHQNTCTAYLTTALLPTLGAKGPGPRNERELRTLSEAIDLLVNGEVDKAGDMLMQRLRAVEASIEDGTWEVARHLELIPASRVSATPAGMRSAVLKAEAEEVKAAERRAKLQAGKAVR